MNVHLVTERHTQPSSLPLYTGLYTPQTTKDPKGHPCRADFRDHSVLRFLNADEMMGIHGVAPVELPLLLACARLPRNNHCSSLLPGPNIKQAMRMAILWQGGQSFQFTAKCSYQKMRSPQAKTNEDGSSRPRTLALKFFQERISNMWERSPEAVRIFPWDKAFTRFIQRVLDLSWKSAKWLAIPVLVLSSLAEIVYSLSVQKDLFILLGIFAGILVARTIGKTALEVLKDSQDAKLPWPLVVMGIFFILLKVPGPYYPIRAAAFLPHVANAGLVQTILLFKEWKHSSV